MTWNKFTDTSLQSMYIDKYKSNIKQTYIVGRRRAGEDILPQDSTQSVAWAIETGGVDQLLHVHVRLEARGSEGHCIYRTLSKYLCIWNATVYSKFFGKSHDDRATVLSAELYHFRIRDITIET